jgi:O-antigen/teichoic acid export membrane protein
MFFNTTIFGLQLWINFKHYIKQFFRELTDKINWNKEVAKLLLKYAVSFIGGFLIFQLFTPMAFKFHGAAFAGKVGISISLIMAVFQIANIWIYVAIPQLNTLVAVGNKTELFVVFRKNVIYASFTFVILSIMAVLLLWFLPEVYASRFLPVSTIIFLLFVWFMQLIINALATLSRAHKVEKFAIPSFVIGIYTVISTLLTALYLPSSYFFIGFISSYLFAFPWFYYLYYRHKLIIIQTS